MWDIHKAVYKVGQYLWKRKHRFPNYWRYPLKHIFRHPYLVTLVIVDYGLRRWRIKPDEWYWADRRLIELTMKEGTF